MIHDDKQHKFLHEGSNRILSKAQILFCSCSHMNCCHYYMLYINLHIIYIYLIKFDLNMKEFQESNDYFESYQLNKIEFCDELYFNLNLCLNMNMKLDIHMNSQFNTVLYWSCVNIIGFFSSSHHIMMVLIEIHDSYHDSKHEPYKQTIKANLTVMTHYECHACKPVNQIITQIYFLHYILINITIQSQIFFLVMNNHIR